MINSLLKLFIGIWMSLFFLMNAIGILGILWYEGFWELTRVMSPFNLWNWIPEIILLLPPAGASWLLERRLKAS